MAACRRTLILPASRSSRREKPATAISRSTPRWSTAGRRRRTTATRASSRSRSRRTSPKTRRWRRPRSRAPASSTCTLRPSVYAGVLAAALRAGAAFGRPAQATREGPVNVEYVSANPTGPMHVGHGRGAVFGDALAALLSFAGQPATREYYINDAGAQVDVLARSAFLRYREALGETVDDPRGALPRRLPRAGRPRARPQTRRRLARSARGDWLARRARGGHRGHDGADPRGPRGAEHPPRGVLLGAIAHPRRGTRQRGGAHDRRVCGSAASSTRDGCRRPRDSCPTIGRTASRRCSARRISGTTSTGRC